MAIDIITGKPGDGKTYTAVLLARRAHRRGRQVFANFPFLLDRTGQTPYRLSREVFREGLPPDSFFVFDEGAVEFNSRDFKNFTREDIMAWTMHRHMGIDGVVVAIHVARIDTVIRELCESIWVSRRLFRWLLYQVAYLDPEEIQAGRPWRRRLLWAWPSVHRAYDASWYRHRFSPRQSYDRWDWQGK